MPYTLLQDWRPVGSSYPEEFDNVFGIIQGALNLFESKINALGSGSGAAAAGLGEIFDRRGVIGIGSYDFTEGVKGTEQLDVAAGGYWDGLSYYHGFAAAISLAGLTTGTYYLNIDSGGTPLVQNTAGLNTVRQFAWDSVTKTVSAKALYAGVSILFDGDDYQAARAAYDSLAERLAAMALTTDPFAGYYAQGVHDGLDFYYAAGKVRNDSVISDTVAGYVTLADDATNYVEVDPADGTVSDNIVGFTSGLVPLYVVVTASGTITDVTDQRTAAMVGVAGVGGGHTQGTDTGTTSTDFVIDSDAAGSPSGRAGLEVENGDDDNASIKFNRDTGQWEMSADGGATWSPMLSAASLNQEGQEWTQHVQLANPPTVLNEAGRGTSGDWEELDLSSEILEAPNGCATVFMLVWFLDAGAGNIQFRTNGGIAAGDAHTVWPATNEPRIVMLAPSDALKLDYFVTASGADTANVKAMLLGYAARVTGVGTLDRTFTAAGLAVGAGATVDFDLTGWLNRGLAHYLKMEETGGSMTGTYDLEIYAKNTFMAADLLYQAQDIDPAGDYEDWLPWWVKDADVTRALHVRIINNDGVNAGTFALTLEAEQFA